MSLSRSSEAGPTPMSEIGLTRLHVLVTAETAFDLSEPGCETGSAVGISTDPGRSGWIRLHPLAPDDRLRAYDIVTIDARRTGSDRRAESWQPAFRTLHVNHHLKQWRLRRRWLDRHVEDSMCQLDEATAGRSLALIRPRQVEALELTPHPGWDTDDGRRFARWPRHVAPLDEPSHVPPPPPRFRGAYRYRCHGVGCAGHRQAILDREFVALQHRLASLSDVRLRQALENTFLTRMCGPGRDTAFYVGTAQASGAGGFRVLGIYWPPRP